MAIIEGGLGRGPATAVFEYNFAVQGGTTGAKTLTALSGRLPDNAVITRCFTEAITPMTSGGSATVKLGYTGNDDAFVTAIAFDNSSWDTADKIAARTAELPIKLDAAAGVDVLATIATAALTAGRYRVYVEYTKGV